MTVGKAMPPSTIQAELAPLVKVRLSSHDEFLVPKSWFCFYLVPELT